MSSPVRLLPSFSAYPHEVDSIWTRTPFSYAGLSLAWAPPTAQSRKPVRIILFNFISASSRPSPECEHRSRTCHGLEIEFREGGSYNSVFSRPALEKNSTVANE